MSDTSKRWAYAVWLVLIGAFALVHAVHLQADFPNHSPWHFDFAKYTDEGWYGNAAVRAHTLGHWYIPGDFNPAPAVPVWPFLEWVLFSFTGVSITAARGLAVAFFFVELLLSYLLLRTRGSRWMALLALTLLVTSPFVYSFSRLAILEPMLTALFLAGLNLAVRLPGMKRPVLASAAIGVLFTLMLLTKTTAVFLLPALGWAMLWPIRGDLRKAIRCAAAAAIAATVTFGGWMALVIHAGLLADYKYLFFINKYEKPTEWYWPLLSLWWSFKGGLWIDHVLIPLAGAVVVLAAVAWRRPWARELWRNPVFGASILALAGYILFMTYQNHPQPRYYVVIAFFSIFVLAMGIEALMKAGPLSLSAWRSGTWGLAGALGLVGCAAAAAHNGAWTLVYVAHPEYTFVQAARELTRYIDGHANGKRLLVSISGDELSMITHIPTLCDDFGTVNLADKLGQYQPGWWATWNEIDPGTLEDLHVHFSLEQVASFRAFDDPDRDVLVLFKLHPLPEAREAGPKLQVPLPGDRIEIPVE